MNWILLAEGLYLILLVGTCLRIIHDTRSASKTLAYLLFAVFVPVAGLLFYFTFGINYRKRRMYSKKLLDDEERSVKLRERLYKDSIKLIDSTEKISSDKRELAYLLLNDTLSPVTSGNEVTTLRNGEEKFPEVIAAMESAKHHIHLEYYIY